MKILLITLFTWLTVANDSLTIVSVGEAEIVREKILFSVDLYNPRTARIPFSLIETQHIFDGY